MIKSATNFLLIFFLLILGYLIGLEKFTPLALAHSTPCGSISIGLVDSPPRVTGFDYSFSSPTTPYPPNSSQSFRLSGSAGHMDVNYFGPYGVNENPSITCASSFKFIGDYRSSGPWSWTVPNVPSGQTSKYYYAVNAHNRDGHGGLDWYPSGEGCAWDKFVWYNSISTGFRDTHYDCDNVGLKVFYVGSPSPQSDLYISSSSVGAAPAGQASSFSATTSNSGSAAANNFFYTSLVVDGAIVSDKLTNCCLASNSSVSFSWSYTISTPGSHWYHVCADTFNNVTNESSESNNCTPVVPFTVPTPDFPDLLIDSLTILPSSVPSEGELVTFRAIVANRGTSTAPSSNTTFTLDVNNNGSSPEDLQASFPTSSLLVSGTQTLDWTDAWEAIVGTLGTHKITVCADSAGAVIELNEGNNCSITIFKLKPDYLIQLISFIPISPRSGNIMSFSGIVKNRAGDATSTSLTRLRIDVSNDGSFDVLPANQTTSLLLNNQTETKNWSSAWTAREGSHLVEVCADVGSAITESNEGNNCSTLVFTVLPPTGPWIQTTGGDIHSNIKINTPGGP